MKKMQSSNNETTGKIETQSMGQNSSRLLLIRIFTTHFEDATRFEDTKCDLV